MSPTKFDEQVSKLRQSVQDSYTHYTVVEKLEHDIAISQVAESLGLPIAYVTVTVNSGPSRNDFIIEQFLAGIDIRTLAIEFELAETRIRQIISPFIKRRDVNEEIEQMLELCKIAKNWFEKELPLAISQERTIKSPYEYLLALVGLKIVPTKDPKEIDLMVKKFGSMDKVYEVLGKPKVDSLKTFGFNAYKELTSFRNKCICRLAGNDDETINEIFDSANLEKPTATDIAQAMSMTRDRIYGILHTSGIRKREKLSNAERAERNQSIIKARQSGESIQTIADMMGLSRVMISNILNEKSGNKKQRVKK